MGSRNFNPSNYQGRSSAKRLDLSILREPISLLRVESAPTPEGTEVVAGEWIKQAKNYSNQFAGVGEGSRGVKEGEQWGRQSLTLFVIRHDPTLVISSGDFVLWGTTLYQVVDTLPAKGPQDFLEIRTTFYSSTATAGLVQAGGLDVSDTRKTENTDNTFWGTA